MENVPPNRAVGFLQPMCGRKYTPHFEPLKGLLESSGIVDKVPSFGKSFVELL